MASRQIIVPAGPGEGPVADLRGLGADRTYLFSLPAQSGIQVALSALMAGPFIPISTLNLYQPTGQVRLFNGADFARAIRPANNVSGAGTIFVTADAECSSGGCGCDPACELTVSGMNNTVDAEPITVATLLFPGDGTYTIQWTLTGREINTGLTISAVMVSQYHVIGGVATKDQGDTTLSSVLNGFPLPATNPSVGGATFDVTGKAASPAAWKIAGCVQQNLGVIPPP